MSDLFRRYVLHNFWLKVFSLLAATTLWYAVAREPTAEIAFRVPIEFQHVPENMEIASEKVPEAQIRIRGPERLIREVAASQIHPVIDLSGARPGERTYDLNTGEISVPHGVEVVQVVPTQFRMELDQRATRTVEVRPRVTGSFPAGYHLEKVTCEPWAVTVMGPAKRINALDTVTTDPVDATGVVGTLTVPAAVFVNDPLVRVVQPLRVRVTITTARNGAGGGGP